MNGLTKNEVSETVFANPIFANGVTEEKLWLKLVKRAMYGRAKPDLLKARMLKAA